MRICGGAKMSAILAAIEKPSPNNDLAEENEETSTQTTTTTTTATATTVNVTTNNNNNLTSISGSGGNVGVVGVGCNSGSIGIGIGAECPPQPLPAILKSTSSAISSSTLLSVLPSSIEQHCRLLEEENQNLKETETRLQQQYVDSQRRERILMRRLANKEQELQDYVSQIAEYKSGQAPGPAALRSALLDPAVNILFEKLKHELQSTRAKLEETQNELSAWKFTPDSNTGKRLMAKCRLLYQENEELGKMTSNGRLAKLEGELAMQKSFSEEVKKSQSELDDFLQELDEDVEGMQSTILFLQQELKSAKDKIQQLEKENFQNKIDSTNEDTNNSINLINGNKISSINVLNDEIGISSECYDNNVITKFNSNYLLSSNNNCLINNNKNNINNSNLIVDNNLRTNINIKTSNTIYNGNDLVSTIATTTTKIIDINGNNDNNENHHRNENLTNNNNPIDCTISSNNNLKNDINKTAVCNLRKRNFEDSDSSENSSSTNNDCTLRSSKKIKKKTRRSSFLRLDLDEEDTQIADESDDDVVPNVGTRRKSIRNHQNGEHN